MDHRPPSYPPPISKYRRDMADEVRRAESMSRGQRARFLNYLLGRPEGVLIIGAWGLLLVPFTWAIFKLPFESWLQTALMPFADIGILSGLIAMVLMRKSQIRIAQYRRFLDGKCRICGYDIRESKERCPECGTPLEH